MSSRVRQWRIAWLSLACALALHVTDEALTGFLPMYNGIVLGIRARLPWALFPVFTFPVWLGGLVLAVLLLFGLTPLVSRGQRWIRIASLVLAVIMVGNALGHLGGSLYLGRAAPGVYSSPFLLAAALALLVTAWRCGDVASLCGRPADATTCDRGAGVRKPTALRRIPAVVALAFLPVALWALVTRLSGPHVSPLPEELPLVVRHPPPSRAVFAQPKADLSQGEDLRRLHARGIMGRNVGIAVIDRPLLTRHHEFADRLRWYDEIDTESDEPAGWHSTAVASIAVGRNVEAAPMADLYFVGVGMIWAREPFGNWWVATRRAVHSGQSLPLAIRRVLELNRRLPAHRRIRALSLSVGGGRAFEQAIDEARSDGLFVSAFDLHLPRLGPLTFASPAAQDAYTTHDVPAGSWAIAQMAGRYALACEEDPEMTPERFMGQMGIRIAR